MLPWTIRAVGRGSVRNGQAWGWEWRLERVRSGKEVACTNRGRKSDSAIIRGLVTMVVAKLLSALLALF